MKALIQTLRGFYRDEAGVTAVEYGLIAALVALVLITGATQLGIGLNALFCDIAGTVWPAAACA